VGRPSRFDEDQILDAAVELVGAGGPAALTVAGVAERLGAPSGSIYHRFGSRDALAGAMWLRAVESFQAQYAAALEEPDARRAARRAAMSVLAWSREHLDEAQVLLLYRSRDFIGGGWPPELEARNAAQRANVTTMLEGLCRRLRARSAADRRRVTFAVVEIPYAAIRTSLAAGEAPPDGLDAMVDDAVTAVLDGLSPKRRS